MSLDTCSQIQQPSAPSPSQESSPSSPAPSSAPTTSTTTSTTSSIQVGRLVAVNPKFPNIELTNTELTIGRRKECHIIFNEPQMSGLHCCIYPPPPPATTGMMLKDMSSNGTFVNGKKVGKMNTRLLRNRDHISFASYKKCEDGFLSYVFQDFRDHEERDEIFDYFNINEELGRGNFSVVKLGSNIRTGELCAIKILDKKQFWSDPKVKDQIVREVQILEKIEHPNCVKYIALFEGIQYIYIVLEYAAGGELFHKIVNGISESEARGFFSQMLAGVHYLHSHGIAHRDIKPENILLDEKGNIKISDFGLARFAASRMQSLCGTPHYVAPEVIRLGMAGMMDPPSGYGKGVDMWSLGVCLYCMLTTSLPFNDTDRMALYQKIEKGDYRFTPEQASTISDDAKHLVSRLLDTNPQTRITAEQALQHPWIKEQRSLATNHLKRRISMELCSKSELSATANRMDVDKENQYPSKKVRPQPKNG
eukprot:TRINITY_DN4327_c0_g1_i1.p1 TRINITY_DN4327_c0_g1~~TRINITY_DN4327_c0_g1_i1.p1  ORF type:complete len:479 (+),score=81.66 TRINITY_DN4327_c0_g1_i1:89-1525(+)